MIVTVFMHVLGRVICARREADGQRSLVWSGRAKAAVADARLILVHSFKIILHVSMNQRFLVLPGPLLIPWT